MKVGNMKSEVPWRKKRIEVQSKAVTSKHPPRPYIAQQIKSIDIYFTSFSDFLSQIFICHQKS
jgi:hypothetical protein